MLRRALSLAAALLIGLSAWSVQAAGTVQALFSPWDDIEGAIVALLAEARESVHVQAYLLTSRTIARALTDAHARGVKVQVLADAEMALKGDSSQVPKLAEAGIPVWLEVRYVNAHNKILLVDAEHPHPRLLTGSYNFTWSAQARNAENVVVIRDDTAIAQRYLNNWQRHWRDARPFPKDE